jgi:glycosyltransferase involved in cell wall biosynthesis
MPDRDSGSIDLVNYMKICMGLGYEVWFLSTSSADVDHYLEDLRSIGVICPSEPLNSSARQFVREHAQSFDGIMLYRVDVAARLIDRVRRAAPHARLIFDTVDLHFLREARFAELSNDKLKADEARRTRERELATMEKADCTILLSTAELDIVAGLLPDAKLYRIPVVRQMRANTTPLSLRRGVLFVGGFAHQPNVDAIVWFVKDIWPLVRARRSDLSLTIVGSSAPPIVQSLHTPSDGVSVVGFVDRVEPLQDRARMTVAPLRYGAGIKGKVVSSLAQGVPCVATSIAVEGTGLADGQGVLCADDPAGFANAIIRIAEDDELWIATAEAGARFARNNFSMQAVSAQLAQMFHDLGIPPERSQGASDV